ncbi:MAG: hypothetical protein K0R12_805 [Gammaproteobacteria bacterium]|nr:hypothetical protein [Gammaproteobacteria bacterium]
MDIDTLNKDAGNKCDGKDKQYWQMHNVLRSDEYQFLLLCRCKRDKFR